jgi:hypothetical protein
VELEQPQIAPENLSPKRPWKWKVTFG